MEALPRMPMLAFELKASPEIVEFASALSMYISEHYHEDPASYSKECQEIEQLRLSAMDVSRDFMGCSILKKYYAQLHYLQSRFPMAAGEDLALPFTWEDVYTGRQVTHADIQFEQACILYNIGALHSNLGALDNRQSPEGMKVSCTHFQCAAWAFQHLRDYYSSAYSTDMAPEILNFQMNLMLAQAQECILEKSMTDNRKCTITAKVAGQIVEYYEQSMKALDTSNNAVGVGSRRYKEWRKRLELKIAFHQCIQYYYQGSQAEEQQLWGQRLTYFQAALDKLNAANKLAKNEEEDLAEALRFTMDVVGGKYNAAKKDNDFIYHEKVPPLESLPEIKGASLVKGIPFNHKDPEISGSDIFHRLVPMEAHEASSLYSEEKARLLRSIGDEIEEKDAELSQFLSSLQMDDAMLALAPDRLPQNLLEKCAAISVRPDAIKQLVESMSSLSSVATDVESSIHDIQELLTQDNAEDKKFQATFGRRVATAVSEEIEGECSKYEEGLSKAGQSNMELHRAMKAHISNLQLLSSPLDQLETSVPSFTAQICPEDEATIQELQRLSSKVEEMQAQRQNLEQKLRTELQNDDITNHLVTSQDTSQQMLFSEQLKKHDGTIDLLKKNMTAQDNILQALTEANAKYANIRRVWADTTAKREEMINSLVQSYDVYEDLLAKSKKGTDFYKKLEQNVAHLLERTRGVCKTNQEEREHVMGRAKPQVPAAPKPAAEPPGGVPSAVPPAAPPGMPPSGTAGLTLKDYLPFMKPKTFGPKSGKTAPSGVPPPGLPGSGMTPAVISAAAPPAVPAAPPTPVSSMSSGAADGMASQPAAVEYHDPKYPLPPSYKVVAEYKASMQPGTPQQPQQQPPQPQRQEAAHTVDTIHGPIVSPTEAPTHVSYPAASISQQGQPAGNPAGQMSGVAAGQPRGMYGAGMPTVDQYGRQIAGSVAGQQPSGQPHSSQYASQGQLPAAAYMQAHMQYPNTTMAAAPTSQQPAATAAKPAQQLPQGSQQYQAGLSGAYPAGPPTSQSPYGAQVPAAHPQQNLMQPGNLTANSTYQTPYSQPNAQNQYGQPTSQTPYRPQTAQTSQGPYQQPAAPTPQNPYGQAAVPNSQSPYGQAQYNPQSYPQQPVAGSPAKFQTTQANSNMPQANSHGTYTQQPGYNMQNSTNKNISVGQSGYNQQSATASASQPHPTNQNNYPQVPAHSQQFKQSWPTTQAPSAQMANTPAGYAQQNIPTSAGYSQQTPASSQAYYATQTSSAQTPGYPQSAAAYSQVPQTMYASQPASQAAYMAQSTAGSQPAYMAQSTATSQAAYMQQPQQTAQANYTQQNLARPAGGYPPTSAQNVYSQPQPGSHGGYSQQQTAQQPYGQQAVSQGAYKPAGIPQGMPMQPQASQPAYPQQNMSAAQSNTQNTYPNTQKTFPTMQSQAQQGYPTNKVQTQQAYPTSQAPSKPGYPTSQPPLPQTYPTPQVPAQQAYPTPQIPAQQMYPTGTSQQAHPSSQVQNTQQGYLSSQLPAQRSYSPSQGPNSQATGQQVYPNTQGAYTQQNGQKVPSAVGSYAPAAYPQQSYGAVSQPGSLPQTGYPPQSNNMTGGYPSGYAPQHGQPVAHPSPAHSPHPGTQSTSYPAYSMQSPAAQWSQPNVAGGPQLQPTISADQAAFTADPSPNLPSPLQPVPASGTTPVSSPASSNQGSSNASPAHHNLEPSKKPGDAPQSVGSSPVKESAEVSRHVSPTPSESASSTCSSPSKQPEHVAAKQAWKKCSRSDPYLDEDTLAKFVTETERFEKLVESLTKKKLSTPSSLEMQWRELNEYQEKFSRQQSMAIARCYPLKNRVPDVMPYDATRVVLTETKDDYINASHIGELTESSPKMIVTQAPLPSTMADFWQMVYEQGTEVVVMLASEKEMGKHKIHVYWPTEKGKPENQGPFTITLQSMRSHQIWVERIINITHRQSRQFRTVVHLQFPNWPSNGLPETPGQLIQFINVVQSFYIQQRSLNKPIIVQCSDGVGRSGAYCVISAGVLEISSGRGLPDVAALVRELRTRRKYMVLELEQLQYCYEAIVYHCQDILMKRGILTNKASFGDKLPGPGEKGHQRKPSEDFILGTSSSLSQIQNSVDKMTLKPSPTGDSASDGISTVAHSSSTGPEVTSSSGGSPSKTLTHGQTEIAPVVLAPVHHLDNGTSASEPILTSLPTAVSPVVSPVSSASAGEHGMPAQTLLDTTPTASTDSLPASLVDLQNPQTFQLGMSSPGKKRMTKSDFINKTSSLAEGSKDNDDPFNNLDPLWSIKKTDANDS